MKIFFDEFGKKNTIKKALRGRVPNPFGGVATPPYNTSDTFIDTMNNTMYNALFHGVKL